MSQGYSDIKSDDSSTESEVNPQEILDACDEWNSPEDEWISHFAANITLIGPAVSMFLADLYIAGYSRITPGDEIRYIKGLMADDRETQDACKSWIMRYHVVPRNAN